MSNESEDVEIEEAWVEDVYDFLDQATPKFDWVIFAVWVSILLGGIGFWALTARALWRLL